MYMYLYTGYGCTCTCACMHVYMYSTCTCIWNIKLEKWWKVIHSFWIIFHVSTPMTAEYRQGKAQSWSLCTCNDAQHVYKKEGHFLSMHMCHRSHQVLQAGTPSQQYPCTWRDVITLTVQTYMYTYTHTCTYVHVYTCTCNWRSCRHRDAVAHPSTHKAKLPQGHVHVTETVGGKSSKKFSYYSIYRYSTQTWSASWWPLAQMSHEFVPTHILSSLVVESNVHVHVHVHTGTSTCQVLVPAPSTTPTCITSICTPTTPAPPYFTAHYRSEERRVWKQCRSRWSPDH